jgi:DNA-binding NarL/FixJ family response regulator
VSAKVAHNAKTVVLVDDHPIMRKGLAELIDQEPDLHVVGEAEDAQGAREVIAKLRPDIAVVDISLRESNGIDLMRDIKARWPDLPVLILSMYENTIYAEHALSAGARGYITKSEAPAKVVEGIRQVLAGSIYINERMASKMLSSFVGARHDAKGFSVDRLSQREFEIFDLIGQGQQTRQVAENLHISIKTVEAHRENIKRKLNLASATDLLKYAIEWKQFGGKETRQ